VSGKPVLTSSELDRLCAFSTPTLCNAIEVFEVRARNVGYMDGSIRCLQAMGRPMLGYAVTGRIRAQKPPQPEASATKPAFWEWLGSVPAPRVVVLQDLDEPTGIGSYWGEIMATVHQALGCVGTVTNGGVRDLEEVRGLGFHYFAKGAAVSHAYVHLVDFGGPVCFGGVTVESGQLIHADQHGVLLIPPQVAPHLATVAQAYEAVEQEFLSRVRRPGLTLERLAADRRHFAAQRAALKPPAEFSE
jgi:4-hydroxy-4-methyl-2-oxoglutarate aldolase